MSLSRAAMGAMEMATPEYICFDCDNSQGRPCSRHGLSQAGAARRSGIKAMARKTPELRLTIELVPSGQWGANLRQIVSRDAWDRLRASTYANAGHRCEICGGRGPRWPVECHERWHYDDDSHVQKLTGLVALCPPCHEVKHMGRARAIGRGEQAESHLASVNGWTAKQAAIYTEQQFKTWHRRSKESWTLDTSWTKATWSNRRQQ